MTRELPSEIRIGGVTLTVRVDPTLESWGEYHADDKEIRLATKTLEKASTLRETLRHELMHAAFDIAGLSHITARFTDMEEGVARCIDNIFHPAWDRVRKQLK